MSQFWDIEDILGQNSFSRQVFSISTYFFCFFFPFLFLILDIPGKDSDSHSQNVGKDFSIPFPFLILGFFSHSLPVTNLKKVIPDHPFTSVRGEWLGRGQIKVTSATTLAQLLLI